MSFIGTTQNLYLSGRNTRNCTVFGVFFEILILFVFLGNLSLTPGIFLGNMPTYYTFCTPSIFRGYSNSRIESIFLALLIMIVLKVLFL